MTVYVITKGCYSDYHICAVTTDPEKAKALERLFYSEYDKSQIEEWDTEDTEAYVHETRPLWNVFFNHDGILRNVSLNESFESYDLGVSKYWGSSGYRCCVFAEDAERAIKVAAEKLAQYRAKEEGLV